MERIKIYDDLKASYEIINAWRNPDCFPFYLSEYQAKGRFIDHMVVEYRLEGTNGNEKLFESKIENFNKIIKQVILSLQMNNYIFKSDFKRSIVNRIRSYKGLFNNELNKENYLQEEVFFENAYSLIASIVNLDKENIDNVIHFLHDSSNCFLFNTNDTSFMSKENIKNIVTNCMKHNEISVLNYLELITQYCKDSNGIMMRMSGDGGDEYFSLQFFFHKNMKQRVLFNIENCLI